jgi:hypothetical protein
MPPYHNQHTLPKFFITGFYDSAEKPTKNPFVWYYPRDEPLPREWRRERAQNISVRGNYYTLPGAPPERRLALENLFSQLERGAAGPLRRLAQGRDPEGFANLSIFIATMLARQPALIEGFGAFASGLLGRPATSYPDRARNKPEPTEFLKTILSATIEDLEPRLRRMTWNVFLTTENAPFIASDCPVAMSLPIQGSRVEDLDHPGIEFSMPLTRRAAVIIGRPGTDPCIVVHNAVAEAVREMNMRTAARAKSFLIASSTSFPGVEDVVT